MFSSPNDPRCASEFEGSVCKAAGNEGDGAGRNLDGLCKKKTQFPVEIGLNPFRSGDRVLVIASVVDITECKRHEEHIRFIMDELSHCSNLLSVVLAIARQTGEQATSFGGF